MRGEQILRALQFIGRAARETADFIDFIVTPKNTKGSYSLSGESRGARQKRRYLADHSFSLSDELRLENRAYVFLYRLKKDGLIRKTRFKDRWIWKITPKGRKKEKLLRLRSFLPFPRYQSEPAKEIVIISFDIPEKEKDKRNWLRWVLKRLKFTMMQRSVWLGKVKIPEEFVEDLKEIGIIDYVEIFVVTKTGTIRHLA